jgi:hypothetical protein
MSDGPWQPRDGQWHWLWLSGVVIALDQWSKHLIARSLDLYETVRVLPVFDKSRAQSRRRLQLSQRPIGLAALVFHGAGGERQRLRCWSG